MEPKSLILAYERGFSARLAGRVLTKPRLNAWMIFIPFIFIFYFQDFSHYKKQRRAFMDNWILSRRRMLFETADALDEARSPDFESLSRAADLPEKTKPFYRALLRVLADHYTRLLRAKGADTYADLIGAAYNGNRGEYLHFVNQLQDAERALNKALAPQLKKNTPEVSRTISKIESGTESLRRQEIENFF